MKRLLKLAGSLSGLFVLGALMTACGGLEPLAQTSILPTPLEPTAIPTVIPSVIPPPPGLPTDEPWPPQVTPVTPPPAPTPQPFPTPAFPKPVGQRPEQLQHLWFPYFPDSASTPQLQSVLVDGQGQRWEQIELVIDLGLGAEFPGPTLLNLHLSPDYRWLVADIAYGESVYSVMLDPSSGVIRPLFSGGNSRFLAWVPNSQQVIVEPPTFPLEVWVIDAGSQRYQTIDFPKGEFSDSLPVKAVAYSPDGKLLADALVYAPTVSKSEGEVEVGVRVGERGTRTSLFRLSGGSMIAEHSLRWSSDGHRLIIIADAVMGGRHTELWIINVTDGTSNKLAELAKGVQYNHPAIWSPDGRSIAAIKESDNRFGNVYLIDPETGQEQQLTRFTDRQISHLAWPPDGQTLAFTVSGQDYGEIWVTSLDGTRQHPIAGPTTPNAPFVWLSGR